MTCQTSISKSDELSDYDSGKDYLGAPLFRCVNYSERIEIPMLLTSSVFAKIYTQRVAPDSSCRLHSRSMRSPLSL